MSVTTEKQFVTVRMDRELAERIEREARREGRTRSSFIRFYLAMLTEPDRKRPEEARQ